MKLIHSIFGILLICVIGCVGFDEINVPFKIEPKIVLNEEIPRSIILGNSYQLKANFFDADGNDSEEQFLWVSSNPTVAEINELGLLRTLAEGQTDISAKFGDVVSDLIVITVVGDSTDLSEIIVSNVDMTSRVKVGEDLLFTAKGIDFAGREYDNLDFAWKSGNSDIITIDSTTGIATGVSIGETYITAEADGLLSQRYAITVFDDLGGTFIVKPGSESYNIRGSVEVVQVGDFVEVRFKDDFSVDDSPDPYAYLSNTIHSNGGALDLGELPKNGNPITGPFSLTTSDPISVSDYKYVVVYCRRFSIPFGSAEIK